MSVTVSNLDVIAEAAHLGQFADQERGIGGAKGQPQGNDFAEALSSLPGMDLQVSVIGPAVDVPGDGL